MSRKNNSRILSRIVISIVILIISIPRFSYAVKAQGLVPCGNNGNLCTFHDFNTLAQNVVKFVLFDIAIPLAVFMIVIGGIIILTSGGNESKVKKGRSMITGTFIGLSIAFGAWLIVNTVITVFFN